MMNCVTLLDRILNRLTVAALFRSSVIGLVGPCHGKTPHGSTWCLALSGNFHAKVQEIVVLWMVAVGMKVKKSCNYRIACPSLPKVDIRCDC